MLSIPGTRPHTQLLAEVYLPLLVQQAADDALSAGGPAAVAGAVAAALGPGGGGSARELLAATQKYLGAVSQALQHARSDAALVMPCVQIASASAAAADPDVLAALEAAAASWSEALAALMQAEGDKKPAGKGPMAELEFWRARSAALCGAAEQLSAPRMREMLAALEAGSEDRQLLAALRAQMVELDKLATEVGRQRGKGRCTRDQLRMRALSPSPAGDVCAPRMRASLLAGYERLHRLHRPAAPLSGDRPRRETTSSFCPRWSATSRPSAQALCRRWRTACCRSQTRCAWSGSYRATTVRCPRGQACLRLCAVRTTRPVPCARAPCLVRSAPIPATDLAATDLASQGTRGPPLNPPTR